VSKGNLFEQIPSGCSEEIFETLAQNGAVKIERIISSGQSSPESGWYDQEKAEWVVVLKGHAIIAFENDFTVDLKAGDYLHIPAHKKHRVAYTQPEPPTIWLAVHY
jgi:cupin 2 domain-containing protein